MVYLLVVLNSAYSGFAQGAPYQEGDLIFHESQSEQSKAIREVTESRWSHVGVLFLEKGLWYVAEAIQPVTVTPLSSFIIRGKNKEYRIYRLPGLTNQQRSQLSVEASKFIGKNYDVYFEWSNDRIYCSEFVYKIFYSATGIEIGTVQKFRDLKLDGPYAKELIRRRSTDTGHSLNLDEHIVTPVSQINDGNLILVEKTDF